MSLKQRLYDGAPIWLQNAAVTAYGYRLKRRRYGPGSGEVRRQIDECRTWSPGETAGYQRAAFARVLDRAFGSVPYYQEMFRAAGLAPGDIATPDDLSRLPLLPKDVVRRRGGELVARGADTYWIQHTSGSTGTPLDVRLNRRTYQLVHGLLADFERQQGVGERDLRATFAGRLTQPVERMTPPFWRYNHAERQLLFSSYHLNEVTLPFYVAQLSRRQPAEIIGYPSAIATVAEYLLRTGPGRVRPRVVITNSETLLAWQRRVIEEAFNCPVRDYYGSAEAVVFAGTCAAGVYHVNPLLGLAEIVDAQGAPAREGQLVCTTLVNTTMPLIRYEVGDTATRLEDPCACGSRWTAFSQILGRVDDEILTPDGRRVGRIDHIFKGLHGIRECQVIQEDPSRILLKIVQGGAFTERDALLANVRERLGPEMQVEIEFVDRIPRTSSGKFRGVISRVTGTRTAPPGS